MRTEQPELVSKRNFAAASSTPWSFASGLRRASVRRRILEAWGASLGSRAATDDRDLTGSKPPG